MYRNKTELMLNIGKTAEVKEKENKRKNYDIDANYIGLIT